MTVERRDKILAEKEARRAKLPLEYNANGDIVRIGKISFGCSACTARNNRTTYAIYTGCECNVKCPYCYYDPDRTDKLWNTERKMEQCLADLYKFSQEPNRDLLTVSYNSWGETLMYMDQLEKSSALVRKIEEATGNKIYNHTYTNGMLATNEVLDKLKSWGFMELRFHLSASNFSQKVLDSMRYWSSIGGITTVEEPSLPEYKDKIISLLPTFEELGVKHLDLVEVQITKDNRKALMKKYPDARVYNDHLWHIYDEGNAYDIIEAALEIYKGNPPFSIIDCNSRIECARDSGYTGNNRIADENNWDQIDWAETFKAVRIE